MSAPDLPTPLPAGVDCPECGPGRVLFQTTPGEPLYLEKPICKGCGRPALAHIIIRGDLLDRAIRDFGLSPTAWLKARRERGEAGYQ